MSTVSRREVVRFMSASVFIAAAGSPAVSKEEEKTLTPTVIIERKFEGFAVVEFAVAEVGLMLTSRATSTDESEPLLITCNKDGKSPGSVYLVVSWEVVTRFKRLGIENPVEHFQGKSVRISGTVERLVRNSSEEYCIQVTKLDQFIDIRKPERRS